MRTNKVKGRSLNNGCGFFVFLIIVMALIGEVRCIYKMVSCNWDPVGKAEIFYTLGTFTGAGAIIGWIDIKDK